MYILHVCLTEPPTLELQATSERNSAWSESRLVAIVGGRWEDEYMKKEKKNLRVEVEKSKTHHHMSHAKCRITNSHGGVNPHAPAVEVLWPSR